MPGHSHTMPGVMSIYGVAFVADKLAHLLVYVFSYRAWPHQRDSVIERISHSLVNLGLFRRTFARIIGGAAIAPITVQDYAEVNNHRIRGRDFDVERPAATVTPSNHAIVAEWNPASGSILNRRVGRNPNINLAFPDADGSASRRMTNIGQGKIPPQDVHFFGSFDLAQAFQAAVNGKEIATVAQ